MDKPPEIIDLAKVVDKYLNGQQLISYSSQYLTKPGDNYGSIMLAIQAKLQNPDGSTEILPLVAKLPPLTSKELWNLFKPEISSLRENTIYCEVSPSIRQLQLESGIAEGDIVQLYAKFYGCRISLDNKAKQLDRDALLVLENLQCSGFKRGNRKIMFDLDHIRLVLKYVANYHAYPIALRHKESQKFERDIIPKFTPYAFFEEVQLEIKEMNKKAKLALRGDLGTIEQYEELHKLFYQYLSNLEFQFENEDKLFKTIAHFDLWINNIMIHYDETGTPDKVKIIDFQTTQYLSLAHDLVFLLFTSVKTDILKEHFHSLLNHYYDEFIKCLKKMLCDTKDYTYQKFFKEIKKVSSLQIPHTIFMSKVLFTEDSNLTEEFDIKALHSPLSPELLVKIRDILRLSRKFGLF